MLRGFMKFLCAMPNRVQIRHKRDAKNTGSVANQNNGVCEYIQLFMEVAAWGQCVDFTSFHATSSEKDRHNSARGKTIRKKRNT